MRNNKKLIVIISALLVGVGVFNYYRDLGSADKKYQEVNFSEFVTDTEEGRVMQVHIKGFKVEGQKTDGTLFSVQVPFQDGDLVNRLLSNKVRISAVPPASAPSLLNIFLFWFPTLLYIAVLLYTSRMMFRGNMAKGKTKQADTKHKTTFADVAALHEEKAELMEVVDFLRNPKKYQKLGAIMPKGVLLVGPPGNGKTMLARAVAGEAKVPFFYMSGSSFVEMYVGLGAARVRELFAKAATQAPCIIFIDEIDAIGRKRESHTDGGSKEFERTLNQLLVEMDGFAQYAGVIVMAATNRDDVLDSALLRRFERKISIDYPDLAGREEILDLLTKKIKKDEGVDLSVVAKGSIGMSAAVLKTVINEATLLAARENKDRITQKHLDDALDRVSLGLEKRNKKIREADRKLTAYHEAGHAVVAYYSEYADPIHKATIIPRGQALGLVAQLPDEGVHMTVAAMKTKLKIAAGGRAAELMKYGEELITAGAVSDIQYSTNLAVHMITKWGLNKALGPVNYGSYLNPLQQDQFVSDSKKELIDSEVQNLLNWAQTEAMSMLKKHNKEFENLTAALLERETLTGDEIKILFEKGELPPMKKESIKKEGNKKSEEENEKKASKSEKKSKVQKSAKSTTPRKISNKTK